jgi:hypothetical protein
MVSVYWVRHQDHTDIFSQGYVGISSKPKLRWNHHFSKPTNSHMKNAINKYGWDNLVKQVILIADNDYCLDIEKKLRPVDFIGWNQIAGGGMPPKPQKGMGKGNKLSEATKQKLSVIRKGKTHSMETRQKLSQMAKDQWAKYHANGNKHTPLPAENE